MKYVAMAKERINEVVEKENRYDLPQFLKALREATRYSRRIVHEDTGVGTNTIFRMEEGDLDTLSLNHLAKLGEYYGVDKALLVKKAEQHAKNFVLEVRRSFANHK